MTYGFVGLGTMGRLMAVNLSRKNKVFVFDQNKIAVSEVAKHGAKVIEKLEQFSQVDNLILCLPEADNVNDVLFNQKTGLIHYLKKGCNVVDTSTIGYEATLDIFKKLNSAELTFLDAPVSGMQNRAFDGTLTMMVGGDRHVLQMIESGLSTMASKILHMGNVGSGQLAKLMNQLLFDINAAALAEILPMSIKLGLDPEQVAEIINSGTGRSFASEYFLPNILKGDFNNGYPMLAAYKDLISGSEISSTYKIPTPVLAAATNTYQRALLEGHGEKDKGGMILVFEHLLNVAFRAKNPTDGET